MLNDEVRVKDSKCATKIFDRIFELFLLAIGSALAYGFFFFYEWGFASVFSIPPNFISIDLITFAMRLGTFIPCFIFVFYFYWHLGSILVVLHAKKVYGQLLLLAPLLGLFGYSVYLVFNSNLDLSDYMLFGGIILMPMWQFWLTFMLLPKTIKIISDHNYLKSDNKIGLNYVVATWENKTKESRGF